MHCPAFVTGDEAGGSRPTKARPRKGAKALHGKGVANPALARVALVTVARCVAHRGSGRMVEPNACGLENRFGPLGPTRVQIPPPPLNKTESAATMRDQARERRASGPPLPPLQTARNRPRVSRDCRAATSRSERSGVTPERVSGVSRFARPAR